MNNEVCVILDPAHGENVAGKRSPDGVHREYIWSRNRCQEIEKLLVEKGYEVHWTTRDINEPGLSKRKKAANDIKTNKVKLLISIHNNAAGSGSKWTTATGVEIYTSKGKTRSDIFSSMMYATFKKYFSNLKYRYGGVDPSDCDKDENFTVLMGNYQAMLIEWLFQDSKEDITLLMDDKVNTLFSESVVAGIEEIDQYVHTQLNHKVNGTDQVS